MIHVRMDDELKAQATAALARYGLSTSEAVRLFFNRVIAEQAFPLELKVPNAQTREAMAEIDALIAAKQARFATAEEAFAALDTGLG